MLCWTGKGDDVTLEEAERFIGFLDTDGDGLISQQEFVKFMCTAMAMTIDSRINFATRSACSFSISITELVKELCLYLTSIKSAAFLKACPNRFFNSVGPGVPTQM